MFSRRHFLQHSTFTAAAFATPALLAEELSRTPRQVEGPFYPNKLPLDTDNERMLTTQIYTNDDPRNATDRFLNSITDAKLRNSSITEFKPIPGSRTGELAANFDIVLGQTPEDPSENGGRRRRSNATRRR